MILDMAYINQIKYLWQSIIFQVLLDILTYLYRSNGSQLDIIIFLKELLNIYTYIKICSFFININ